jgi:hypothetical protein
MSPNIVMHVDMSFGKVSLIPYSQPQVGNHWTRVKTQPSNLTASSDVYKSSDPSPAPRPACHSTNMSETTWNCLVTFYCWKRPLHPSLPFQFTCGNTGLQKVSVICPRTQSWCRGSWYLTLASYLKFRVACTPHQCLELPPVQKCPSAMASHTWRELSKAPFLSAWSRLEWLGEQFDFGGLYLVSTLLFWITTLPILPCLPPSSTCIVTTQRLLLIRV